MKARFKRGRRGLRYRMGPNLASRAKAPVERKVQVLKHSGHQEAQAERRGT
jgi:hypothetical protein